MKVAVIGSGELANEVLKLLPERSIAGVNDIQNLPTAQTLHDADFIVVSVPDSEVSSLVPLILESNVMTFWENQKDEWPLDWNDRVKSQKTCWIISCHAGQARELLLVAKSHMTHPKIDCGVYLFFDAFMTMQKHNHNNK